ncbi:hypothetical protein [Calothrix sp. 336/3]|uniref:hypothetical protein n=1 Tax=Calothrix sp. 336/3 TaxID=1337936 RepID=UPI0004E46AA0|nr:hypothetical protein [Calothrix sp. 336/3]AKG22814.1 hypothetical protein IJ00_17415 [Calothrix sp. 336/3]
MIITLIIAWIVFTILVKIVKTTVKTAFIAVAVIVLLQISYGVTPVDIWNKIVQFNQSLPQGK